MFKEISERNMHLQGMRPQPEAAPIRYEKAETADSDFLSLSQKTIDFFRDHQELSQPLPGRIKRSLFKALTYMGILLGPAMAHAQSGELKMPDKMPEIELGTEVAFDEGRPIKSLVFNKDFSAKGLKFELGGKVSFSGSVFVPETNPEASGRSESKAPSRYKSLKMLELDTANTIFDKGNLTLKELGELHRDENGVSWFFGMQGEYNLSSGVTPYINSGRYFDFTSKDSQPRYRLKTGLQTELKPMLGFLPAGTAYIEFGSAGREKGFTLGFIHKFGGKSK